MVWGSDGELRMILSKVKVFVKIGRHLEFSFGGCLYGFLKKEISKSSNAYDEVFFAEVVNIFQPFTIFAKKAPL